MDNLCNLSFMQCRPICKLIHSMVFSVSLPAGLTTLSSIVVTGVVRSDNSAVNEMYKYLLDHPNFLDKAFDVLKDPVPSEFT